VNTVATPAPPVPHPPTMAVLPSAETATDIPWLGGNGGSPAPLPMSLLPCCVQASPLRVNTHAAPVVRLSLGPATMAVLPSAETATDAPWLRVNTHAAPAGPTSGRSRSALLGAGSTHDGGVAVRGQRNGHALVSASHRAGSDQLRQLLEGPRRRVAGKTGLRR
jgi:hypothetical protein